MQGNLNEIDIRSILQLVELGQRTGELFVESYGLGGMLPGGDTNTSPIVLRNRLAKTTSSQSWFVFFLNGQIIYAGDARSDLSRLRDYLRRYHLEASLNGIDTGGAIATTNTPEYGHLWALLEQRVLTPAQARSIIHSMVRETLFDLLSLHQGSFIFEVGSPLAPQLTTLEIGPLLARIMTQVQSWKKFHPHIQSPDQGLVVVDGDRLRNSVKETTLAALSDWMDGQISIRQISRYLNRDLITVAKALYPHIKQGTVQLAAPTPNTRPAKPKPTPHTPVPRIVCIDDGTSIRKAIESILRSHGYEATSIGNPLKALSLVFQLKPDLILCDISMPELDGYEICAMLRTSTAFRQTPIIMLTGRDGFIDRVRARIVGATDYLTKPFGEQELLTLVETYIGPGLENPPNVERLLAEDLENALEIDINPFPANTSINDSSPPPHPA
ncbi:response regulator [Thermoleptolyngbya sp.]